MNIRIIIPKAIYTKLLVNEISQRKIFVKKITNDLPHSRLIINQLAICY